MKLIMTSNRFPSLEWWFMHGESSPNGRKFQLFLEYKWVTKIYPEPGLLMTYFLKLSMSLYLSYHVYLFMLP